MKASDKEGEMSKMSRPGGLRDEAIAVRAEKMDAGRQAQEALKRNESILRAQAPWTEQQERLLRAAQAVVSDAGSEPEMGRGTTYMVASEVLDELKAIVQEIGDDAAALVRSEAQERQEREALARAENEFIQATPKRPEPCGDEARSTGRRCLLPKGHAAHGKAHSDGVRHWN